MKRFLKRFILSLSPTQRQLLREWLVQIIEFLNGLNKALDKFYDLLMHAIWIVLRAIVLTFLSFAAFGVILGNPHDSFINYFAALLADMALFLFIFELANVLGNKFEDMTFRKGVIHHGSETTHDSTDGAHETTHDSSQA